MFTRRAFKKFKKTFLKTVRKYVKFMVLFSTK